VFWSRDPDGTQHFQGDSLNALTPGINGPTSLAGVKNADDNLATIRRALDDLGLAATTDIVIAADHGFSTISKESETSPAAKARYADVRPGFLPPGFVALDLAKALGLPLFDPDAKNARVPDNAHPKGGNGLIGQDAAKPDIVVAANGGSDLVYLPNKDRALAARVVDALLAQDYVSGLFVDDDVGTIPGTLPLSAVNLKGAAKTPVPSIVVNFRSFSTGCEQPVLCTVEIADTPLQQGQGMHGSFSRADTMNFMAAAGPSFRRGYVDNLPVSNADVGQTLARLLGLNIQSHGSLKGRVIEEALPGGAEPACATGAALAEAHANGLATTLSYYQVGNTRYFSAAGFRGRTVGLHDRRAQGR
jgi:arylsulfatase A-like enzyme